MSDEPSLILAYFASSIPFDLVYLFGANNIAVGGNWYKIPNMLICQYFYLRLHGLIPFGSVGAYFGLLVGPRLMRISGY